MRIAAVGLCALLLVAGCDDDPNGLLDPEIEISIAESESLIGGTRWVQVTFRASSTPSAAMSWSLTDLMGTVGPLYGRQPRPHPIEVEVSFPASESVAITFIADPDWGHPESVTWARTP